MRRCISVLFAITFVWVGASAQKGPPGSEAAPGTRKTAARVDVRGVWKVTELASRAAGAEWEVRAPPYLSQYVFTEKHYRLYVCARGGPAEALRR